MSTKKYVGYSVRAFVLNTNKSHWLNKNGDIDTRQFIYSSLEEAQYAVSRFNVWPTKWFHALAPSTTKVPIVLKFAIRNVFKKRN